MSHAPYTSPVIDPSIPYDVIVVGAGVAGLCAAQDLLRAGVNVLVLEGDSQPGGRVKTTNKDGFLLDDGFQVLLTAYPELQERLNLPSLGLKSFYSGAKVRVGHFWSTVADPFRHPLFALTSLCSDVGTVMDKLRTLQLRTRLQSTTLNQIFAAEETATERMLNKLGFSQGMIDRFFRPFYGGIFLERALTTSSRMFEFTYKMFTMGYATLPADGMGAIARQLAQPLETENRIAYQQHVAAVTPTSVTLADGQTLHAKAILLAVGPWQQHALLAPHTTGSTSTPPSANSTTCMYFRAKKVPSRQPWLYLNGNLTANSTGPVINHVCFPSTVQPNYAPAGEHLVSVSLIGAYDSPNLPGEVLTQLQEWFGPMAAHWFWLDTKVIPHALPNFAPPTQLAASNRHPSGVFCCGDAHETPSLNGAMASGRRAAYELRGVLAQQLSAAQPAGVI